MLKKILSIRNVGRFRDSAADENPELSRLVLIFGANGSGKSTIGAVLRSLATREPSHLDSLGLADPPAVSLLFSDGVKAFAGGTWSASPPALAIFDESFVDSCFRPARSGVGPTELDLVHVLVGADGARLAAEEVHLVERIRRLREQLEAAEKAIVLHLPSGMELAAFVDLPPDATLEARISEHERLLAALRRPKEISERPAITAPVLPTIPQGFTDFLARPVEGVDPAAEAKLAEHLATHGLGLSGREWIAKGLDHIGNKTCPLCGSSITGAPMMATYRNVFSIRQRLLGTEVDEKRTRIREQFGEGAVERLWLSAEQYTNSVEFWSRYCGFDRDAPTLTSREFEAILGFGRVALALLDEKARSPLVPVAVDEAYRELVAALDAALARGQEIARAAVTMNARVEAIKKKLGEADASTIASELERFQAIKRRHEEPTASMCANFVRLSQELRGLERQSGPVRARLEEGARVAMGKLEGLTNRYLEAFNAGFRIMPAARVDSDSAGGSSYRLVLAGQGAASPGADANAIPVRALGAGDRSTLALAVFLATLENAATTVDSIVVFDEPCRSQDSFRSRQVVQEIGKLVGRCSQVIVLSRDARFLHRLWERTAPKDRVALTLADHGVGGSKIRSFDLEGAAQGRSEGQLDALHAFVTTGVGQPIDVIRAVRAVLATHCHTTYPDSFDPVHDSLEDIVSAIAEVGEGHPAFDLYGELSRINDYTVQYHHRQGSAFGSVPKIDASELARFVRRTLSVVNALQA